MSLTPASNDPNRRAELARAKQNPFAFGGDAERPEQVAKRDLTGDGLVPEAGLPVLAQEPSQEPLAPSDDTAAWLEFASQSVNDILGQLVDLTDEQLAALREVEVAGKSRKTLIEAIDAAIEARAI